MEIEEAKIAIIGSNLEKVQQRIAKAAERSGRHSGSVKLIAVTKLVSLDVIQAGIQNGITCFGENYADQAAEKIQALEGHTGVEWHMIGHIQSRKAQTVCEYFDFVHSVDRMKIARYLDRYSGEMNRGLPVVMEGNVRGEDSKFGWPAYDEEGWENLLTPFRQIAELPNLEIRGLMSMPPLFEDPEKTRPLYKKLVRFRQYLQQEIPDVCWDELSIGTSFDYEVAIEEGATMVRVGTDIFGSRPG
jgi:hypothetical protein